MNATRLISIQLRLNFIRISLGLFGLGWTVSVRALDPAYLDEMPSMEKVLADIQGKDQLDTWARQSAATTQLWRVIEDMAGDRLYGGMTPDEKRLRDAYKTEGFRLTDLAKATIDMSIKGEKSPWAQWYGLQGRYERDKKERNFLLARYFSDGFLRQLGAEISATDRKVAQSNKQMLWDLGIRESDWEKYDLETKIAFIIPGMFSLGLIGLWFYRETRRFGISPKDPFLLRAGFRNYDLYYNTGTVTNYTSGGSTTTTTTVTDYNDGSRDSKTKSSSYTYESFDLVDGSEKKSHLIYDSKMGLANGHKVTSIQAVQKRNDSGYYIAFLDHTANSNKQCKRQMHSVFKPKRFVLIALAILIMILSMTTEDKIISFMDTGGGTMRGLLFAFCLIPTWMIFSGIVSNRRIKRFLKKDAPVILRAIEDQNKKAEPSVSIG